MRPGNLVLNGHHVAAYPLASMRPGPMRPGNQTAGQPDNPAFQRFNEARADAPGKPSTRGRAGRRKTGFNEARADAPGKLENGGYPQDADWIQLQ